MDEGVDGRIRRNVGGVAEDEATIRGWACGEGGKGDIASTVGNLDSKRPNRRLKLRWTVQVGIKLVVEPNHRALLY